MAGAVAKRVADREVLGVAVAAFTKRLYVFKRCSGLQHMFAAYPTRHHAMHLPGHRFVNFVASMGKFAHGRQRVFMTGGGCNFRLHHLMKSTSKNRYP